MFDPIDPLLFYCCFLDGEEEISCPHCRADLAISSEDPVGQESFQCDACDGLFTIDWDERAIYYEK